MKMQRRKMQLPSEYNQKKRERQTDRQTDGQTELSSKSMHENLTSSQNAAKKTKTTACFSVPTFPWSRVFQYSSKLETTASNQQITSALRGFGSRNRVAAHSIDPLGCKKVTQGSAQAPRSCGARRSPSFALRPRSDPLRRWPASAAARRRAAGSGLQD
jgi:hypothetical protein